MHNNSIEAISDFDAFRTLTRQAKDGYERMPSGMVGEQMCEQMRRQAKRIRFLARERARKRWARIARVAPMVGAFAAHFKARFTHFHFMPGGAGAPVKFSVSTDQ